jgi:diguanylate cyclase (GGDEF)-like protein/PAS domain S-box-containing protein
MVAIKQRLRPPSGPRSSPARSGSLKFRLTLFTLVIFLVSVWSLAFYASQMLRTDMERLLGEHQFATVSLVAEQVNTELDGRLQALERIAADVSPAMLAQPAMLQAYLEPRLLFQHLFNGGVSAVGPDGTVLVDAPPTAGRVGVNYMDRDYIIAALKEGKASIGRPVIAKTLRTPALVMATPIRDAHGKVIGALFGGVYLDEPNFLDQIMGSHYGHSGGYLLFAPQHRLFVTATDKSRIMQPTPAPGINPLFDRYMQGYEGHGVAVSSRGIEELTATKNIPVAGWRMGLVLPTAEAFAPIHTMQRRMLLATVALTVLIGGLIWYLVASMLRRQLSPMVAAARTLANLSEVNQPVQPLAVDRDDEIGELIGSFNRVLHSLNQREAFLQQILDTSSVAIFLVDLEGRITLANRRMADMFQCPPERLLGREYVSLLDPAARPSGSQNMRALLDGATSMIELDRLFRRPDHGEFWGRLTGKRFYDANGEERGLIGVIDDISARRMAEEKLHLDASVFTHAHEGIMITGADGAIIDVNAAFSRITGYAHDEIIGKNPRVLSSGRQGSAFYAAMWDDLNSKGHWYGEVWNRRKDGEVYAEMLTVSAVRDADGHTRQYVALFSDITERKQMEDQVRQLAFYDPLTLLPNRRLLNDRLRQAMAASKRDACYGAMMVLDLDNFKSLNDTHGHLMGDLLLVEAARRLSGCVRAADTVARFGGDEFVVMLTELSADLAESRARAATIAEKIRLVLASPYQLTLASEGKASATVMHQCSASIGVVLFIGEAASQDDILKWADAAMYQAKDGGRNQVRFHARADDAGEPGGT